MTRKRVASPLPSLHRPRLSAELVRSLEAQGQGRSRGRRGVAAAVPGARMPAKSEVFARLGEEVRGVRLGQGCSAGALARRCGISRSMLSRIENGQASPSVDTLQSLAEALEVPVSRFFCRRNGRPDLSFVPAGAGIHIDRMGEVAGFRYELLGHLLSGNLCVEPYLVRLEAGAPPFADFQQPGLQFVYLLSGRLRYRHGARVLEMSPGDALLFEARAPHGVEQVLAEPVNYLAVTLAVRE